VVKLKKNEIYLKLFEQLKQRGVQTNDLIKTLGTRYFQFTHGKVGKLNVLEGYRFFGEVNILPDEIELPEYFTMVFLAKKLNIPLAKIVDAFSGYQVILLRGGHHKIKLNGSNEN
jgi:hypothetical protein